VNVAEAVRQAEEAILRCRGVACEHAEKSPKHVWVEVSLEVLEVVRVDHIVIRTDGLEQACVSCESTRPNGASRRRAHAGPRQSERFNGPPTRGPGRPGRGHP